MPVSGETLSQNLIMSSNNKSIFSAVNWKQFKRQTGGTSRRNLRGNLTNELIDELISVLV